MVTMKTPMTLILLLVTLMLMAGCASRKEMVRQALADGQRDLSAIELKGADLKNAGFEGADLTGASFESVRRMNAARTLTRPWG